MAVSLLAGHPGVYGFPELLLFNADNVHELLNEGERRPDLLPRQVRSRLTGVCRALADLHEGNQSDAAVNRACEWLACRPDWPTSRLLEYMLTLIAPRIGVEKSPDTVADAGRLAALAKGFPSARFIHLTRHPTDSLVSMQKHFRNPPDPDESLAEWCADMWYSGHLRITRFLAGLPDGQWFRVHGEDLVREPAAWLPKILGWLDLEVNDSLVRMMLKTEHWRFANRGESGLLYGGDPKFLDSPGLRSVPAPGPVSFDPGWGLSPQTRYRITALADHLGYLGGRCCYVRSYDHARQAAVHQVRAGDQRAGGAF